jgi:hypothetical protein
MKLRQASKQEKGAIGLPRTMRLFSVNFTLNPSSSQPNAILCNYKFLFNYKILAVVESSSIVNPLQL